MHRATVSLFYNESEILGDSSVKFGSEVTNLDIIRFSVFFTVQRVALERKITYKPRSLQRKKDCPG